MAHRATRLPPARRSASLSGAPRAEQASTAGSAHCEYVHTNPWPPAATSVATPAGRSNRAGPGRRPRRQPEGKGRSRRQRPTADRPQQQQRRQQQSAAPTPPPAGRQQQRSSSSSPGQRRQQRQSSPSPSEQQQHLLTRRAPPPAGPACAGSPVSSSLEATALPTGPAARDLPSPNATRRRWVPAVHPNRLAGGFDTFIIRTLRAAVRPPAPIAGCRAAVRERVP